MDRTTLLWTVVLFLGASLLFGMLRRATDGASTAVTVGVQLGGLAIVIGTIVIVVRKLR